VTVAAVLATMAALVPVLFLRHVRPASELMAEAAASTDTVPGDVQPRPTASSD